jgi:hypothetical protein
MVQDHDHPGSLLSCLPLRVPRQVRQDAGEASILETDRPMMPRGTGVWGMASQHGTGSATVRQEVVKDMHQKMGALLEHPVMFRLGVEAGRGKSWDGPVSERGSDTQPCSDETCLPPDNSHSMLASIRGCHQNR